MPIFCTYSILGLVAIFVTVTMVPRFYSHIYHKVRFYFADKKFIQLFIISL